jgi:hypothetical protein
MEDEHVVIAMDPSAPPLYEPRGRSPPPRQQEDDESSPPQTLHVINVDDMPLVRRVYARLSAVFPDARDTVPFDSLCYCYVQLKAHAQWLVRSRGEPTTEEDAATRQYLSDEVDITLVTSGLYEPWTYTRMFPPDDTPPQPSLCRPVRGSRDTFLVNKRLDHIYAELFDEILLQRQRQHDVMAVSDAQLHHMLDVAEHRSQTRRRWLKLCRELPDEHQDPHGRLCPLCWVLYTRLGSAFYEECRARLASNAELDFTAAIFEYAEVEHLAFPLVLFLCGDALEATPHEEAAARGELLYNQTNQWLKVPLWFLLLTSSSSSSVTQENLNQL